MCYSCERMLVLIIIIISSVALLVVWTKWGLNQIGADIVYVSIKRENNDYDGLRSYLKDRFVEKIKLLLFKIRNESKCDDYVEFLNKIIVADTCQFNKCSYSLIKGMVEVELIVDENDEGQTIDYLSFFVPQHLRSDFLRLHFAKIWLPGCWSL